MANIKSAIKRARQNTVRRKHNAAQRSMLRTYMKNVLKLIENKDMEPAKGALVKAQSIIDKAVKKGLMHKNTASRHMTRLSKKVKNINQAA